MANWTAATFVAGHASLDFLNTAGGSTRHRDVERLASFADAVEWARTSRLVTNREAEELLERENADPSSAEQVLAELRSHREALHAFLLAAITSAEAQPGARERVESDVRTAYLAAHLPERLDDVEGWYVQMADAGLHVIGHRLALSTGNLLAGDDRRHIRICQRCSWMFLDPSPTKRRRWCSMETCGNRAKARRHYNRSSPDTVHTQRHEG